MISLLTLSIISAMVLHITNAVDYTVLTPLGKIEGKTVFHDCIPVRTYLGIPYAKQPIGSLRFQKPVPVEPWNTTLQAKNLPPGCIQYSTNPFPWLDNLPGLSMDCLYLNIWTPMDANIKKKKSVMFWIHGGGFRISSSRLDVTNGQVLAAEGDVIVVTINYRLGAEGFFYSGTEDAPGNMGMWDIAEALKWVRSNIQSFGGDENSITLFGQSAGAIAIGMMCVSPVTKGQFKRAILQSGSPVNMDGEDNGKSFEISQQLAERVGCANDKNALKQEPKGVVECMKRKEPFELAVALAEVTANSPRSYYPRYGDNFLPTNPRQAILKGDFSPVDTLIGSNTGDGASLITKFMKDTFGFFGEKNPQINYTFGSWIIKEKFKHYSNPDAVVTQYLDDVQKDDYKEIAVRVFTAAGDYSRVCPSNYFAESLIKKNVSVYYYYFVHTPSNSPWAPWMLAVHFDETPFVFGHPLRYPQNYTLEEQKLSRRMIDAWSNFAKTGVPEHGLWPSYTKENTTYQVLDVNTFITIKSPNKKNCEFFRS